MTICWTLLSNRKRKVLLLKLPMT
ncbi:hypothetical protein MAR_005389 [Mya arenaria]|uniref:Uncharacterized protein n=1 Tax=Mya arenaria TaxID=6604 RepID=A0ABY7F1Q6_MYAAR|nr:hypothetical protein MAR_005389 [Mya arenaria]